MIDESKLQRLHGEGPIMTNAALNRTQAVRMFKAGMSAEQIARAFPKVFSFTSGEGGGLGQKYDSIYVASGRMETKYTILKSAVDDEIRKFKAEKRAAGGTPRRTKKKTVTADDIMRGAGVKK